MQHTPRDDARRPAQHSCTAEDPTHAVTPGSSRPDERGSETSTIMSRPGLLVVPAFGLDLTLEHYLASLRTSVGIARALSGSLLRHA